MTLKAGGNGFRGTRLRFSHSSDRLVLELELRWRCKEPDPSEATLVRALTVDLVIRESEMLEQLTESLVGGRVSLGIAGSQKLEEGVMEVRAPDASFLPYDAPLLDELGPGAEPWRGAPGLILCLAQMSLELLDPAL
jgi:hypothetical protein